MKFSPRQALSATGTRYVQPWTDRAHPHHRMPTTSCHAALTAMAAIQHPSREPRPRAPRLPPPRPPPRHPRPSGTTTTAQERHRPVRGRRHLLPSQNGPFGGQVAQPARSRKGRVADSRLPRRSHLTTPPGTRAIDTTRLAPPELGVGTARRPPASLPGSPQPPPGSHWHPRRAANIPPTGPPHHTPPPPAEEQRRRGRPPPSCRRPHQPDATAGAAARDPRRPQPAPRDRIWLGRELRKPPRQTPVSTSTAPPNAPQAHRRRLPHRRRRRKGGEMSKLPICFAHLNYYDSQE